MFVFAHKKYSHQVKIEPWTILTMFLKTFQGRQVSIPQEAYGLVCEE